jgi:hypothetical protein
MVYRKGELSKSTIDREWPHQVALAASFVAGRNFMAIHHFCRDEDLSLCPRQHFFRRNDRDHVVYCFAVRDHAERFHRRFGGERIDPATRPKWPGASRGFDAAAESRHRNGRCAHCDD